MINPNGLYGHVPSPMPLSLDDSGFDPLCLPCIVNVYTLFQLWTGPTLLIYDDTGKNVGLDNHCSDDRH